MQEMTLVIPVSQLPDVAKDSCAYYNLKRVITGKLIRLPWCAYKRKQPERYHALTDIAFLDMLADAAALHIIDLMLSAKNKGYPNRTEVVYRYPELIASNDDPVTVVSPVESN